MEYYAIFSCDTHKSWSSMRLLGVYNEKKGKTKIRKEMKEGNVETELKSREIKNYSMSDLNDEIDYLYIEPLKLNEEVR